MPVCPDSRRPVLCWGVLLAAIVLLALSPPAAAQSSGENEGVVQGNYNIKQSFEVGYRHTDFTGSRQVYQTFLNFNSGARLLEHQLEMRSLDHQGWLFDNLWLSSTGYGGDPNAFTRLRFYKNDWYNFSGSFRVSRNYWDYNLLANPLNPLTSNPPFPLISSPHRFETVRRMTDYNLTILPQSPVRFRLGYARNIHEGPSFVSPRMGTETLAFQDYKTTLNSYTFGVDFRALPRTNISFDQFLHYYKGDTTWADMIGGSILGLSPFIGQLSNGTLVDLGISFNTAASQPCAVPITDFTTSPPTVAAACNGFLAYSNVGNIRSRYPTSQLSFQSNYFKKVDLSGRFSYSSSDYDLIGYDERGDGRTSRTNLRRYFNSGPAETKRVAVTADFGLTWYVTSKLRIIDSFRFQNFRLPGFFDLTQLNFFGATMLVTPNTFTPGTAPPANCNVLAVPPVTTGCPAHNTSSPADVIRRQHSTFLAQDTRFNQLDLAYDFTRRFGVRLGYRVRLREITLRSAQFADLHFFPTLPNRGACAGQPLQPDGSCRTTQTSIGAEVESVNEHSVLFGINARPHSTLRTSFDLELFSADHAFTRISPRNRQRYNFRGHWKPSTWATVSGTINILESRNNVVEIAHRQHSRNYGFAVVLHPSERLAFDFGYNLQDIFSQTNICFTLTGAPLPPGSSPCPQSVPAATTQALSFYDNTVHFGHFDLMWKPVPRLRTFLGYTLTSTSGDTLILAPLAPRGSLAYNYHQPRAGLEFDVGHGFTGRAFWNHYGYNEKAPPDPATAARDFRGNMFTLSVRYGF